MILPGDEGSCLHKGVVGSGFEYHVLDVTGKFVEPVYGTALYPIDIILEEPGFIRLAELIANGKFDDDFFCSLIEWHCRRCS